MFLHKELMELITELRTENKELRTKLGNGEDKQKVKDLEWEIKKLKDIQAFEIEKAKDTIRKDMRKALIESDLKRTEAIAKLNTYIDMDTKDERKHIQKMLEKAIDSLGSRVAVQKSKNKDE